MTNPRVDQTTLIIPEGQRYHPLGAKIRKLEYQFPDHLPTTEAIRNYLKRVREEVIRGGLSSIPTFYQDLALSTANAESFRSLDAWMRQEFEETVERIVEKLMAQTMRGNELEFRGKRARAFLRPLAYLEIPDEPDFIWGYATAGDVNTIFPRSLPPRCHWGDINPPAYGLLDELRQDLSESLKRRHNPKPWKPAKDQCFEPAHPTRYRMEPGIGGDNSVNEGGQIILSPNGISQLEYGPSFSQVREIPAQYEWSLDGYTCDTPPMLTPLIGNQVVFQAPGVLRDCHATAVLRMSGPYGVPQVATKEILIRNSENESPEIAVSGPGNVTSDMPATLQARISDPNGDTVTIHWEQVEGPPVEITQGTEGESFSFNPPLVLRGETTIVFRATATDQPLGGGSPATATALHEIKVSPTPISFPKIPEEAKLDEKRQGLVSIASTSGGKPQVAREPGDLVERVKQAATPEQEVEFIDLVIAIDASDSMSDDVGFVQEKVGAIIASMKKKVKGQDPRRIRIGIVSYVNNKRIVHLPLTKANESVLKEKLAAVIERIKTDSGSLETVWDALFDTIEEGNWRAGKRGVRKVVYLTDEPGDIGKKGRTAADVARVAKAKHVIVEPIFIVERGDHNAAFLEVNLAFQRAMAVPPDRRLEVLKNDYLPTLRRLAPDLGGQTADAVDLTTTLFKSLPNVSDLSETVFQHVSPWISAVDDDPVMRMAIFIYERAIQHSQSSEQKVFEEGLKLFPYLKTRSQIMNFVEDLFRWANDAQKAMLIESYLMPVLLKIDGPRDGTFKYRVQEAIVELRYKIEQIQDPKIRLRVVEKHLKPLLKDKDPIISDAARQTYEYMQKQGTIPVEPQKSGK